MARSKSAPAAASSESPKRPTTRALQQELAHVELELALEEARYTRRLMSGLLLQEGPEARPDRDEANWSLLSSGGSLDSSKSLPTSVERTTSQKQSYRAWRLDPHARGILRNFVKFIIGRELTIDFADEQKGTWADDRHAKLVVAEADSDAPLLVRELWEDASKNNRMRERLKEFVLRAFREGEAFLRRFRPGGGRVLLRFVEPDRVAGDGKTTPGFVGKVLDVDVVPDDRDEPNDGQLPRELLGESTALEEGIEHLANDVETVVAYWLKPATPGGTPTRVPAHEMIHRKPLADSNDLRGFPILEVVLKNLTNYAQWEEYRMVLNKVRAAVALVRKVEGTPTQGAAIVQGRASGAVHPQGREPQTTSGRREPMFRPGTTLTPGPGVSYDFLSPKLDARDAGEDGRRFLMTIAAGLGLPEMLVTGDWSNASYSSSVEARTPAVREWEDWQDYFEDAIVRIWEWVRVEAIRSLGLPRETNPGITIQWPTLIAKDALKETERRVALHGAGLLSKTTWAAQEDLVWDAERENLRLEAEEEGRSLADDETDPARDPAAPDPVNDTRTEALASLAELDALAQGATAISPQLGAVVQRLRPFIEALATQAQYRQRTPAARPRRRKVA